ncbi:hypothetical protein Golomagni_02604 [Golovinomyces magnicellulatus]|nr:hypothetical protein Golomagni_02604 [Golovinomyces magnicellulatus]
MVQGIVKSKVSKNRSTSRNTPTSRPKKGARTIAPKKAVLVRQKKLTKNKRDVTPFFNTVLWNMKTLLPFRKFSAGLTAMTERTLGSKVGHLELLNGGGKSEKETERQKGGTKKFG